MAEFEEKIAPEYCNTTEVSYRDMKILCKFLKSKDCWYVRVKTIDEKPVGGYGVIAACYSRKKEKGVDWAKRYIDLTKDGDGKARLDFFLNPDEYFEIVEG